MPVAKEGEGGREVRDVVRAYALWHGTAAAVGGDRHCIEGFGNIVNWILGTLECFG